MDGVAGAFVGVGVVVAVCGWRAGVELGRIAGAVGFPVDP